MRLWSELRSRLAALIAGRAADRETQEEIRFHLEMEAKKLEQSGLTPPEARRRARVAFGGVAQTQEEVRGARGIGWWEELTRDLRYATRQLRRSPGFTLVAVLTLALGIGANTAIFSVVDGVLLRPVPLADPSRLVMVWEIDRTSGTSREPASWPDYVDFRARARTLDASAIVMGAEANLTPEHAEPARLSAVAVSAGYFDLIGLRPSYGRGFTADDDVPNGPKVVMLGDAVWRARFGADPAILGRTIRINDENYAVVGIVPRGTDFGLDQIHARVAYHAPYASEGEVALWFPAQADERSLPRLTHPALVLGRLASTATVSTAQQELAGIAAELEKTYPSNVGRGVHVEQLTDVVFGPVRPVLWLLLGAVGLVLLVACVNVANLLLARGATRAREVAVRGALGAGLGRLGRQFVVEAVLLSILGGVAGVGLAYAGLHGLLSLAPANIPRVAEVGIDGRVLLVTLLVSLSVGTAFGLVPTFQARRLDLINTIRGESPSATSSPRRRQLRQALVVTELALSVVLVVSAGLLIRSFKSLLSVDPGFHAAGILKAQYQLPPSRYPRNFAKWPFWTEVHSFNAGLLDRVQALPGVESVALAAHHPLDPGFTNSFQVVGRETEARDWPEISCRLVSPGYFSTLGVRLLRGRLFEVGDDANAAPVALVNETTASRFFPKQDPIGQQIRFWGTNRRIVGVVSDEKVRGLTEASPPATYAPLSQVPSSTGVLLVRTTGAPLDFAPAIRRAVWDGDPELAVFGVEPLADTLSDSVAQQRFTMLVLGGFSAVALALALVGVYGVLSYATAQRTREIGIRVALGASRTGVAGLIVRGGLGLAALGVALGMLGAAAGSGLLRDLLFGVRPLDPVTYVVVPGAVLLAAVLATWVPARRAARVAPTEALRAE